jgi:hypothetical protein
MNVGVAIGAVLSYVGEDGLDVALHALHFFVHAAQRVLGFAVVEFGNGANRAPTRGRVAVFAGDVQRTVRAARGFFSSCGARRTGSGSLVSIGVAADWQRQHGPESELEQ